MRRTVLAVRGLFTIIFLLGGTTRTSAAEFDHLIFRTIRRGDSQVLASLLRQGTPVCLRSENGTTPLMYAALRGDAASVKLLLQHGADPNAANKIGATALLWGAGEFEKVQLLMQAGAKPNHRSKLGNTALIVAAAYSSSTKTVKLLLDAGADLKAKNNRGTTALRSAVIAGDIETTKLLFASAAAKSIRLASSSHLSTAAGRGYANIVQLLLKNGADPNAGGGRNALNSALLAQRPDIARMLIDKGAKFDKKLSPGRVPSIVLAAYTETGDDSIVRLMIEKNAELNAANQYEETVLTWAKKRGHSKLIKLLLESGAKEKAEFKTKEIPNRQINLNSDNQQALLTAAITKSIARLQRASDGFLKKRASCISCHHQNMPSIAIGWARDRGIAADEKSIQRMIDGQYRSWKPRIDRAYQMDRPVPVAPRFIGYGLLGFAALGYVPDDTTEAMVWYLAKIQQSDGHWVPGMLRPPLGGAEIVATVLAMRSLQLYQLEGRAAEMTDRISRARNWLVTAKPRIHQERVFRLLGLAWAGMSTSELADAIAELSKEQREDGGWAQLPGLKSDAWATGQTLVALRIAGGIPTSDPAYQRGIMFLLRTQFDDGSWYVRHRTWPFQTHFESEFPHGRDQWVSAPATAWATMALTLAVTPSPDVVVALRNRSTRPSAAPTKPKSKQPSKQTTEPISNSKSVDFVRDIKPILQRSCLSCHAGSKPKGGFRMTSRALLLKGGESGVAAVVLDNSDDSPLIRFVSDKVEDLEMPPLAKRDKFPALSKRQIELMQKWIRQGVPWPKGVVLKQQ